MRLDPSTYDRHLKSYHHGRHRDRNSSVNVIVVKRRRRRMMVRSVDEAMEYDDDATKMVHANANVDEGVHSIDTNFLLLHVRHHSFHRRFDLYDASALSTAYAHVSVSIDSSATYYDGRRVAVMRRLTETA